MTTMSIYLTKARIRHIKQMAQQTLLKYNFPAPPVDPMFIVQQLGELYNFSDPDEKGFTRFIENKYKIYINNVEYSNMSIWTYAHEAGHIILDHFRKYDTLLTNDMGCAYIDKEANTFAAELLMPEEWIYQCIEQYPPCTSGNLRKLVSIFNVSWDSLFVRLHTMKIQKKKDSLEVMKGIETHDLRAIIPEKQIDEYNICIKCGNSKNKYDAQYCFICGSWSFEPVSSNKWAIAYEDGIPTDARGHALACPVCGNTEELYGDYCEACDACLVQKCEDQLVSIDIDGDCQTQPGCDHIPSGNARFCECCGNRTSFYNAGYLVHWSKYNNSPVTTTIEEAAAATNTRKGFLYGHTW